MASISIEGGGPNILRVVGYMAACDLHTFRHVVGTSSGGILAVLLCVGWTPQELIDEVIPDLSLNHILEHDATTMSKVRMLYYVVRQLGLNRGDRLFAYLGGLIARKTGNPDTTFAEAYHLTHIECLVTTVCWTTQQLEPFSNIHTPDTPLRTAARCTASLPGLFMPACVAGKVYIDGAGFCNNPAYLLREHYNPPASSTYVFRYDRRQTQEEEKLWASNLIAYIVRLFMLMSYRIEHLTPPAYKDREIWIPSTGHTLTGLSSDLAVLVEDGRRIAQRHTLRALSPGN